MSHKWCIGDIRGDLPLLEKLIDQLSPVPETDFVLFTGSYLGPGPDSKGTIDYLIEFKKKMGGSVNFLVGCYEHMFQAFLALCHTDKTAVNTWMAMGGKKVLESYGKVNGPVRAQIESKVVSIELQYQIPESHVRFMEQELFTWYYDHTRPVSVFHAGPDMENIQKPDYHKVIFGYDDWWESSWRIPGVDIVFSHIPFKVPFRKPGKVGIDLGAGWGGKLCAYEFISDSFVVVENAFAR